MQHQTNFVKLFGLAGLAMVLFTFLYMIANRAFIPRAYVPLWVLGAVIGAVIAALYLFYQEVEID